MALARYSLRIALVFFSAASVLVVGLVSQASAAEDETTWTIMVYMAADSEPVLPWEEDVNEMEGAALPDWMRVLVLVDPPEVGDSMIIEVAADDSVDLEIVSPEVDDSNAVIPLSGEVDTASPVTLADFVRFCGANYPADRLVLVLWGHSGGWYGLCQDGDSLLQLTDLGLALKNATDDLDRRLDMVIADTCVEGVVETIYEVRESADWYIGSETSVPAQGLPYDIVLDSLAEDGSVAPQEWGAAICEIHRMTLLLNSLSATLAVTDLRAFDPFIDRLDELSGYMEGYADLYRDRFMEPLELTASSDFAEWYLDAGDALKRLAGADLPVEVRSLALDARLAYEGATYTFESWASPFDEHYYDVVNCTGAAVFAPSAIDLGPTYSSLAFRDIGWADATVAIREYEPEAVNGAGPGLSYEDTDGDDEMDEATLSWPAEHGRLVAWVFAKTDAGLEPLETVESSGSELVISGPAGELLVSASAWDSGTVVAHHELDIILTREVEVSVRVMHGEETWDEDIEVVVRTGNGSVYLDLEEGSFTGSLTVPGDADYGDLVTVEVLGPNGDCLAQNRTYVTGSSMLVEVRLLDEPQEPARTEFLLPMTGLLISAVVLAIYLRARRERT